MGGRYRTAAAAAALAVVGAIGFTGVGLSAVDPPGSVEVSSPAKPVSQGEDERVSASRWAGMEGLPLVSSYVGMVLTAVPPGVTETAGMVVSDRSGALTDYAVSLMRDGQGDMLWLSRLSYPGGVDVPTSQVLDVVRLPALRFGESVTLADCIDAVGGPLPDSVAIFDETFGVGPARVAWRADPVTDAFVPMAATGLSCGYADEGV